MVTCVEAFVVLAEDRYETAYGDGYHAYLARVFRREAEATAWIARQPAPGERTGTAYHVRRVELVADERARWRMLGAFGETEHVDVAAVCTALGVT